MKISYLDDELDRHSFYLLSIGDRGHICYAHALLAFASARAAEIAMGQTETTDQANGDSVVVKHYSRDEVKELLRQSPSSVDGVRLVECGEFEHWGVILNTLEEIRRTSS